jgi:hypothetical protein
MQSLWQTTREAEPRNASDCSEKPKSPGTPSCRGKKVLLLDGNSSRQVLRVRALRKYGLEVDCAADIGEARSLWHANVYNLVLLNCSHESSTAEEFCGEIKKAIPGQLVGFLVGRPGYVASAPNPEGCAAQGECDSDAGDSIRMLLADDCRDLGGSGRYLETAWRIAASRALKGCGKTFSAR